MKIVVLVKEVPDTYGERKLNLASGLAERGASDRVLDEITERALEVALVYADAKPGTEVIALSMAPEPAATTIRKVLAVGADSAVQVIDDALVGADLGLTAEALAAALKHIGFDLVIAGNSSTDGAGGVIPAMIAEILDVPHATSLDSVTVSDEEVSGRRTSDGASMNVSATLPAVISITEALPDVRFANFRGIMTAKKKPLTQLSLADLGVDATDQGAARSIVLAIAERSPRTAGTKIIDEGDAGEKLAEFLVQNRLV